MPWGGYCEQIAAGALLDPAAVVAGKVLEECEMTDVVVCFDMWGYFGIFVLGVLCGAAWMALAYKEIFKE